MRTAEELKQEIKDREDEARRLAREAEENRARAQVRWEVLELPKVIEKHIEEATVKVEESASKNSAVTYYKVEYAPYDHNQKIAEAVAAAFAKAGYLTKTDRIIGESDYGDGYKDRYDYYSVSICVEKQWPILPRW